MRIAIKEIQTLVREQIPEKNENIEDDFRIKEFIPHTKNTSIYYRDKYTCPFGRGNWIIEINFFNKEKLYIKLPKEMEKSDVERYFQPMAEQLGKFKRSKMN